MTKNAGAPVGGNTAVIAATPTITAGAYAIGDAVGGLLEFVGAGLVGAFSGIVHGLTITDKSGQNAALDLVLFDRTFTPTADNAPFDPSDADLANIVAIIAVESADYKSFTDNSAVNLTNLGRVYQTPDGAGAVTSLFGQLVARSAPTYVSTSDLKVKIHCLQD